MLGARYVAIGVILVAAWNLLPDAPLTTDTLTIPDVFWNPLVGVLSLNRYLPISALLAVATFAVGIQGALFFAWLTSWVWNKVAP